ncbi:MAG TPA: GNAT family N-acetyltransferase [Thermoanaerobaculia bacterium]|nr:GNAT family N-acetyltransferase [Thermoanaerobaculia bacterium]
MADGGTEISAAAFVVRCALESDYAAFAALYPELKVNDSVPGRHVWEAEIAPFAWVAAVGDEVVGYCYCQEYDDTGYVRNLVVAAHARRRGVGRALMETTAAHLRQKGRQLWCLNVKADNEAALALYEGMGLRIQYALVSLRLPWQALAAIPDGQAVVRRLDPARDAAIESRFMLPRGQLAFARGLNRLLFEAVAASDEPAGLAVFDPGFPGAFPFRVADLDALAPLLRTIRSHARPDDPFVRLVAEDDPRLVELLVRAGAEVREEMLHLKGPL